MLASANALSKRRTRSFNRFNSFISSGRSPRILLPRLPLPYLRTQDGTVSHPRMPYFRRTCSQGRSSCSSSRTTAILKASLYRRPLFSPARFAIRGDNLFQDRTLTSAHNPQPTTHNPQQATDNKQESPRLRRNRRTPLRHNRLDNFVGQFRA